MSDAFIEHMVPVTPKLSDKLKKAGLIALTVLLVLAGVFVNGLLLIGAAAAVIACFVLFPRFNKEYEYSYVNGDIDISVIYSKESRRALDEMNLEQIECIAPLGSHHLDSYGDTFRTADYSSGDRSDPVYVAVQGGSDKKKFLLCLSEEILDDLRYRAPRKVFRD